MIQYIKNNAQGSIIYQEERTIMLPISNLSYIKKCCLNHLFTYEGYLKAVQLHYGKSYKIPVFIDEYTMMIPIRRVRDYNNIWINFAAIDEIIENNDYIQIYFFGNRQLDIKYSIKAFKRQIDDLLIIRSIKGKHFHS